MKQTIPMLLLFLLCLILLGGCGAGSASDSNAGAPGETAAVSESTIPDENSPLASLSSEQSLKGSLSSPRSRGEVLTSEVNQDKITSFDGGFADLSQLEKGFVAVSYTSSERLKFQVKKGEETYNYDLPSNGEVTVFPLSMGNGTYELKIMQNVGGTKYTKVWGQEVSVALLDDFQPFLRPSQIVPYSPSDPLVDKAYEISEYAASDLEIAAAVYSYLKENVTYDHEKAASVQSGYLSDPSATLISKDGICFDYASLAAAMLRSQNVPCQVIFGYVGEDELYHAWNRIYLKETGWLSVEIQVNRQDWKRVDITFAAGGTSATTLEDDARYTNRFIY